MARQQNGTVTGSNNTYNVCNTASTEWFPINPVTVSFIHINNLSILVKYRWPDKKMEL
jgi:hypothetical protein